MSVDHSLYVGVYLRAVMPTVVQPSGNRQCGACGRKTSPDVLFCPRDGYATQPYDTEVSLSLYEFLSEEFDDGDLFAAVYNSSDGSTLVLANHGQQPGHIHVGNDLEYDMPPNDFTGDWVPLMAALDAQGIPYERRYGIVSYYS